MSDYIYVSDGDDEVAPSRVRSALLDALDRADYQEPESVDTKARLKAEAALAKEIAARDKNVNKLRTSKIETLNEIHVYVSPDLAATTSPIAAALPEIKHRLEESSSKLVVEGDAPSTIKFKRLVKARYDGLAKRWIALDRPEWQWEGTVVVVVTADELVESLDRLDVWARDVRGGAQQLVVMVKGLKAYNSRSKSIATREFTAAARTGVAAAPSGRPSKESIDAAIVKLQVGQRAFLVYVEKTEDVEEWIINLAADVAIRPYKLLEKAHLNFCPADGVKKGATPLATFELLLQEVSGITPSASAGIAAEYGSFNDLMEAYERAERRGAAEYLLEDCHIRNLKDGTESGRRLNKALAKRVHRLLRGQDSLALA